MKKFLVGISMLAVVAPAVAARADLTIGVVLSTTGPAASLGIASKNAAMIGPSVIAGQKVRYVIYDDGSDTTNAAQNVKRLVSEDKVDVLIGPSTSASGLAAVSIAAEAKTPMLQLVPSPAPISAGDAKRKWIFYGAPTSDTYATATIKHMVKHGIKTVSVISMADAYGETSLAAYKKISEQSGIKNLVFEKFKRSDTSATAQVLRAMQGNPDAVFIIASGTPGALPHVALVERGYKGKIYQSGGSANTDFLRVGGKALEGSFMNGLPMIVAEQLPADYPAKKESLEHVKAYEAKYGAGTRSMFAAEVWNSFKILEATVPKALKSGKPGTEKFRAALRDAIESTKGLKGAGMVFNFSPTDHDGIDLLGMCIMVVENGKWKLAELAEYK